MLGKDSPLTALTVKKATHQEMLELLGRFQNNAYFTNLITNELNQRFLGRIGDLAEKQIAATADVAAAVNKLDSSSDRLETLTQKLNRLTWALIWLTVFAIAVTIGIEVWHAKREIDAPVAPIVLQPLQYSSPQTPIPPPR